MIVAVLTMVNGVLAMSELAVVSSRPARLQAMAAESRGAATALRLAKDPGRFLSSVQIGITLVGILSGAFSGATLGARLAETLRELGLAPGLADPLGVGIVVVAITYLSLIVGELVPKQIALRNPEAVASRVAPLMALIATVAAPLVWLLDVSGKLVLRLLGQSGAAEERVTEEEIRTILAEATSAGVIESAEREMIAGVMRFADRSARGLMTPRREVEIIDLADPPAVIEKQLRASKRTRLPVQDGDADAIIGVLLRKDLINVYAEGRPLDIRKLVREAPVVMDRTHALDVLKAIRASTVHLALVFDEYGHFEGVISSGDVLEAITGSFQNEGEAEPAFVTREDGSWLIAGWMPVDEMGDALGVRIARSGDFETLAGYVISELGRLPEVGEAFDRNGWRFEVVDLDGRRVDKLLVSRAPD
ncbi:CNNM domain-containing protein [Arsenicitalea aurantiaca]|uniref:CNNM domain-containing protein n=1 Tax=Arsenicitalea aurantiaca TaxID=1783274 RepID=UPI00186414FF